MNTIHRNGLVYSKHNQRRVQYSVLTRGKLKIHIPHSLFKVSTSSEGRYIHHYSLYNNVYNNCTNN